MSAASRRASRERAAAAQALVTLKHEIDYHAHEERAHLKAAEAALQDEHTRLAEQAHAHYHRRQYEALTRKLEAQNGK